MNWYILKIDPAHHSKIKKILCKERKEEEESTNEKICFFFLSSYVVKRMSSTCIVSSFFFFFFYYYSTNHISINDETIRLTSWKNVMYKQLLIFRSIIYANEINRKRFLDWSIWRFPIDKHIFISSCRSTSITDEEKREIFFRRLLQTLFLLFRLSSIEFIRYLITWNLSKYFIDLINTNSRMRWQKCLSTYMWYIVHSIHASMID